MCAICLCEPDVLINDPGSQIELIVENKSLVGLPEGIKLLAILDEDWPFFLEEKDCGVRDKVHRWEAKLKPSKSRNEPDAVFATSVRQVKDRRELSSNSHCSLNFGLTAFEQGVFDTGYIVCTLCSSTHKVRSYYS